MREVYPSKFKTWNFGGDASTGKIPIFEFTYRLSFCTIRNMGVQLILIAAVCATFSNYFMRRSIDVHRSTTTFLVIQLFLSCIVAIFLNPVRLNSYSWSFSMAAFGLAAGIILGFMMRSLGKALEVGPPGLTFAMVNSASVMPGLIMALIFGAQFGYYYTKAHAIGSILVVGGLFWAGWKLEHIPNKKRWLTFAILAFVLHMTGLAWMQWRALFIKFPDTTGLLLNFDMEDVKSQWFLPMLFFGAFLVQVWNAFQSKRRFPEKREIIYGFLGGIANGAATFFLMLSTEYSSSWEHAMIFPIFAVTIIILCNVWGQWFYKEKVNWWANALCVIGLFIGTMDWSVFIK